MRHVTCNEQLRRPYQLYKHTGAPRSNWYEDNMNRTYAKFDNDNGCFDYTKPEHVEIMEKAAVGRNEHDFPHVFLNITHVPKKHNSEST